mgnify:CR=1 FL=1
MFLKNIPISDNFSMLKITKLHITTISVYVCDIIPFFKYFFKKSFSIIKNTKKYNPHKIKFQLAPCQNPVNDHTIKIFNICLKIPFLFPPKGI